MVTTENASTIESVLVNRPRRFYRPELDALRLFAFVCVLVHHGAGRPGVFVTIRRAGGFGLSLFFLLSAYLITELLLQERADWGRIHLKSFYIRRILRIWPLYYAALVLAILIGRIPPHLFSMNHKVIVGFTLFVVNWMVGTFSAAPLTGPMWSISIEEQFYLIWPLALQVFRRVSVMVLAVILIASSIIAIGLFSSSTWLLWYNTAVEFLFFGTGAATAVILRKRRVRLCLIWRLLLAGAGLASWAIAARCGVGTDRIPGLTVSRLYIGYAAADIGCLCVFFAFLGASFVPKPIAYLGKISYGLYVFHAGMTILANWLLRRMLASSSRYYSIGQIVTIDLVAFIGCVAMAALSYQFLEKPFLSLKERFAFVKSRPA